MAYQMKYLGKDPLTDWFPLVPASDHEVDTKELADELAASGLYEIKRRSGSQSAANKKEGKAADG